MDTDDVPPLEDMTQALMHIKTKPVESSKSFSKDSTKAEDACKSTPTCMPVISEAVKPEKSSGSFGGMKKGFLFGGQSKPSQNSEPVPIKNLEKPSEVPFIKKKKDPITDSRFRFAEVQSAVKLNDALMTDKDELLKNIEKNEMLCKRILDPSFKAAITEFQTDPEAALEKYKDNVEIQSCFKDFCSIIGDHFSKLGDQQPTSAPIAKVSDVKCRNDTDTDITEVSTRRFKELEGGEDARVKEILDNPEIKAILLNPKIRQLMDALKNDPQMAERLLQTSDREFHNQVYKLVQAGDRKSVV